MKIKLLKSLLLATGITVAGPNVSSEILIDMDLSQTGIQSTINLPDTGTSFSAAIIARNVTDLLGCEFTLKIDTTKYKFISNAYGSAFDNSMPNIWANDSSWVKFTYARMAMTPQYLTASEAQLGTVTIKNKTGFGESAQIDILSGKFSSAGPDFDDFMAVASGTYSVFKPQYSIIISTTPGGTINPASIPAEYNTISSPITATPDGCHKFKSWELISGNLTINSPALATTTITAQSSGEIRATYSTIQYTLTVNSDINGSVTGSGVYDCGVQPAIAATPNTGYLFSNWTVDGNGLIQNALSANTSVTLSGAATITAHFTKTQYPINIIASANGTVSPSGIQTINHGDSIQLIAQPVDGYSFVNWTITEGTSNVTLRTPDMPVTWAIVNGAATMQANFIPLPAACTFLPKVPKVFDLNVAGATLQYTIPEGKQGQIKIKIMDISGKSIIRHVASANIAGYFRFDLKNLQKGCYICTMKTGDFCKTVKFVLVR